MSVKDTREALQEPLVNEQLKERESYSFAISNNIKEINLNKHIQSVIADGTTVSKYLKMLIKKDMEQTNNIEALADNEAILHKITEIRDALSNASMKSTDKLFEKLLEIDIKLSSVSSGKQEVVLDRLSSIMLMLNNNSSVATSVPTTLDYSTNSLESKIDELLDIVSGLNESKEQGNDDIIDSLKTMSSQISKQEELIRNLTATIAAQSNILTALSGVSSRNSAPVVIDNNTGGDDEDDEDIELARIQEKERAKAKRMLDAPF